MEIGLLVLVKIFLSCFFTIYAQGGHLDDLTSIMIMNFRFPARVPKRLHTEFSLKLPSGF